MTGKMLKYLTAMLIAVLSISSSAVLAADEVQWLDRAGSSANTEQIINEIADIKSVAGYADMGPVAAKLVEASLAESNHNSAKALAEVALAAAPDDPRVLGGVAQVVYRGDFGKAAGLVVSMAFAYFTDPWVLYSLVTRALLIICFAGALSALAVMLSAQPYHFPPMAHDFVDRFPRDMTRYTPMAFVLLVLALFIAAGGGLLIFILLPGLAMLGYMKKRVSIVVTIGLVLLVGLFSAFNLVASMAEEPGDRAFALYRVWKGDSGPELDAELKERFGEAETEGLVARAILARRAGDGAGAKALLATAETLGGDTGVINFQLGGLHFLDENYAGALEAFGKAIDARPNDWLAWYNLNVVHLARLELAQAEQAIRKASAIDANAMEEHQSQALSSGDKTYPTFRSFPAKWITGELLRGARDISSWPKGVWSVFGFSHSAARPEYFMIFIVLGFLYSLTRKRARMSKRCSSCGTVKCPKCHRIVKGADICGGCWTLNHETGVDPASKRAMRESIVVWTKKSRRMLKFGSILLPGWNRYVYEGGFTSFLVGILWSVTLAVCLTYYFFPVPIAPWADLCFPWYAVALLGLCYVGAVFKNLKR